MVKRVEACFINFYSAQDVVLKLECAEGARGVLKCFEDGEKLVLTHLLFLHRIL